jgi:hypothetical protein
VTRPLYLLAPRVSREEVPGLRRLFPGRQVLVCDATSHTPGQLIPGDVVVVGDDARTAEQDCAGAFVRHPSVDALRQGLQNARAEVAVPAAAPTSGAGGGEAERPDATPPPPPPDFDKMDRTQLIQYAGQKHPGHGRWVTMGAPAIREKLRELEAGD